MISRVSNGDQQRDPAATSGARGFVWLALGVFAFVVVAGVSGAGDSESEMPAQQETFITAVTEAQNIAEGGNEVAISKARDQRAQSLCRALTDGKRVKGWLGVVTAVGTELGGDDGTLEIEVAPDVAVETWSNEFSDLGDDTLIEADSALWNSLADLAEGDEVEFAGTFVSSEQDCVRESSLMETNSVATPSFIFQFTEFNQR